MNLISAVRDFSMFNKCVRNNQNCTGVRFHVFDNREENKPIPVCYNSFLEQYDYSTDSWFVFCHEDFELREKLSELVDNFDKRFLHGVVGGCRKGLCGFGMQVIYGNMIEVNRDGSGVAWYPGRFVSRPLVVEAFDCCCLIVHSSLVKKYNLRFDENVYFDFYVEDFCAMAKVKYRILSYVHPVKCCHHSGSKATERFYRHLPYLEKKYPKNCFVGTLTYFGTPTWQKRLQDKMMRLLHLRN